ncbi:hypothetical protein [Candidatus Cyanaurora vandensis]|uniref:hypothetical protein n=2 Tax=Candidatus Cyanaurora vandensis TaxID=2714958 RepID=UPI00257E05F3|nr:hypothetical protein [Candidatus Cyanaurora vandensis]
MRNPLSSAILAGLVALGSFTPVLAQNREFNVGIARVSSGTIIPVAASTEEGDDTLYLDPGKSRSASLLSTEDVYDANGNLAIPEGSEVRGTFKPVKGGLKFVADSIRVRGRSYPLQASTKVIRDEKDPREYGAGAIAGDAALGAAGGALIGALTGGVSLGGTLAGAAVGAGVGNVTAPQVVVVSPSNPVELRVQSPFTVRN